MRPVTDLERELLEQELRLLEAHREAKAQLAGQRLIPFVEFTMPVADDPLNAEITTYSAQLFHHKIACALERVEVGTCKRLLITAPPRHGKSELSSIRFPAWFLGRNPTKSIIQATYNETFAQDFGRAVRGVMRTPEYAKVFPEVTLRKGSADSQRLTTVQGGSAFFAGRGGAITGRGGDVLLVDDPIKDQKEADSQAIRDAAWKWYNNVLKTRGMTDTAAIVLITTRWHEDDVVGRIIDPENPEYDADEAGEWEILHFPALAEDGDILGRKKGEALWPDRFSTAYLKSLKKANPRGFSALYQNTPAPEEGVFFLREHFKHYKPNELPKHLRYYAASDHAVATTQRSDWTVLLVAGVDDANDIWIVDAWWQRAPTDRVVEGMIGLMSKYRPIYWWAERGHISKSIGPFLYKRMRETQTYCAIVEVTPVGDKQQRAQSIQGRMSMGKVFWPPRAWWYTKAEHELLTFPGATYDDFVDALAHLGNGIAQMAAGSKPAPRKEEPKPGTLGALKAETKRRERMAEASNSGW